MPTRNNQNHLLIPPLTGLEIIQVGLSSSPLHRHLQSPSPLQVVLERLNNERTIHIDDFLLKLISVACCDDCYNQARKEGAFICVLALEDIIGSWDPGKGKWIPLLCTPTNTNYNFISHPVLSSLHANYNANNLLIVLLLPAPAAFVLFCRSLSALLLQLRLHYDLQSWPNTDRGYDKKNVENATASSLLLLIPVPPSHFVKWSPGINRAY